MAKLTASLIFILLQLSLATAPLVSAADNSADESWDPFSSSPPTKKKAPPSTSKPKNRTRAEKPPAAQGTPAKNQAPPPKPPPQESTANLSAQLQGPPAPVVSPARETSISRMMIPLFKARVKNRTLEQLWLKRRKEIQQTLLSMLNARSFIEVVSSSREYGLDSPKNLIVTETQTDGGDGALIGEFQGQSLELSVKTGLSGRSLTQISIPVLDLARQSARDIAAPAVDAIVASFRYAGFVLATHGREAKINVGKNQGINQGSRLEIFEFSGENPTFSSPIRKIGEIVVTQTTKNAALGEIVSYGTPILPYSKVALEAPPQAQPQTPAPPPPPEELEEMMKNATAKDNPRFWIYAGAEFFYIDTQVSGTGVSIQKRIFQVPLSPAFDFGLGYSRISLDGMISTLSNTSNSVSFLQGDIVAQVYRGGSKTARALTSVGLRYAKYTVTPSANPITLLISNTIYSPLIEERLQWIVSPISRFSGALRLYYPLLSNDAENGNSGAAQSYGGGLEVDWRHDFSKNATLDLGTQLHYFLIQNQNSSGINEFEYSLFSRLILSF